MWYLLVVMFFFLNQYSAWLFCLSFAGWPVWLSLKFLILAVLSSLSQLISLKIPLLFIMITLSLSLQTRFLLFLHLCLIAWIRGGHRIQICCKNNKFVFKDNYFLSVVESERYIKLRSWEFLSYVEREALENCFIKGEHWSRCEKKHNKKSEGIASFWISSFYFLFLLFLFPTFCLPFLLYFLSFH